MIRLEKINVIYYWEYCIWFTGVFFDACKHKVYENEKKSLYIYNEEA